MEVSRLVNHEENGCRSKIWIHRRPTRLITVGERLPDFFFVTTNLIFRYCLALDVDTSFWWLGTTFNLAKLNIVPCMFTATLSQTASR